MWQSGDGMGWWMIWGGIMMVLFWGGLIALFVWAVQSLPGHRHEDRAPAQQASPARPPLEIAKERYARGEITQDEFVRIKRDLEGT